MSKHVAEFDQQWEPCPQGLLARAAGALRAQQATQAAIARRNVLTGVVAAVAIALGAGIAAWEATPRETVEMVPVSQLECDQATNIMPRVFSRQVSREEGASIRFHLDACPRCSKQYYRMLRERGLNCESEIR